MMGIGFLEIIIIAIFVLILFGPQKLPELMREFGKFFVHTKRLSNEVRGHFENIMNEAENSIIAEEGKKKSGAFPPLEKTPPHSTPKEDEEAPRIDH